jgi:hypothetical protein
MAALRCRLAAYEAIGGPDAPLSQDRECRTGEVDSGLAIHGQGQLLLVSVRQEQRGASAIHWESRMTNERQALTAIHSMIGGYAGQPSLLGDIYKIADAALASVDGRRMAETGTGSVRSTTSAVPEGETPQ